MPEWSGPRIHGSRGPLKLRARKLLFGLDVEERGVLVVDPDALVCWALEKELAALGLNVESARTGTEAWVRLREKNYDLLLLDIRLPDRDGFELLGDVRRLSPRTRIVVLSCDADNASKRRAFVEGVCQFLDKPFDLSEVVSAVRSCLEQHPRNRKHDRYLCRLPASLAVVTPTPSEALTDLRRLSATTIDVASGGLRVATRYSLREGQRLRVALVSRDHPCSSFVSEDQVARVVWTAPATEGVIAGLCYVEESRGDGGDMISPGGIS